MMREFHRPVHLPSANFDQIIGGEDPEILTGIARDSAWGLLARARGVTADEIVMRIIEHAATDGIDDVAELWGSAGAHTLAGALWRLYAMRKTVQDNPELVAIVYRAGAASRTVNPVIAGARTPVTPDAISELVDEILRGVFAGDFAAALDRAWAYARVMAEGATIEANHAELLQPTRASVFTRMASRYLQIGADLETVAKKWRAGTLD